MTALQNTDFLANNNQYGERLWIHAVERGIWEEEEEVGGTCDEDKLRAEGAPAARIKREWNGLRGGGEAQHGAWTSKMIFIKDFLLLSVHFLYSFLLSKKEAFKGLETDGEDELSQEQQSATLRCHLVNQVNVAASYLPDNRVYEGKKPLFSNQRKTYHLQDGATNHTARISMDAVNTLFPGRVISQNGDIAWPPRSPDLTVCDFFLWGHIKIKVFGGNPPRTIPALKQRIREEIAAIPVNILIGRGEPLPGYLGHPTCRPLIFLWGFVTNVVYQRGIVDTLEKLRQRIINAAVLITPQMLSNTWQKVEYRLDVFRVARGAHIELH
ncbi:hypothetical protein ANN_22113 [Periplaneta americana]|uniref:Uncharacterized protein n=1 Tax=Periplaneta americana TaxID=6978 RepID=A0ABQ8S780_PERAM|nr:hypothetical protein ANN_22113 [Periplaneta americana]